METINTPKKFTRKVNIFLVIFIILIGGLIGGYAILRSKNIKADMLEQLAQNFNMENVIDDYDYDGLADWEEEIYKTNPINPDTDGDGYLDGEEVASGFDPTKKAPNDKLQDEASQQIGEGLARPAPGNLSQMFGYIMSSQLKAGQMPLINTQDINSIDQNVMEAIDEKVAKAIQKASAGFLSEFIPPFEKENYQFKFTQENNLTAIRNYAKEISDSIGEFSACHEIDEYVTDMEAVQKAIESKNFEQLDCFSKTYFQAYHEIIKLSAPLDWFDIHKRILSTLWVFHKAYHHLSDFEKDPLKGIIIIKKLEQTQEIFLETFEEVASDIESREN